MGANRRKNLRHSGWYLGVEIGDGRWLPPRLVRTALMDGESEGVHGAGSRVQRETPQHIRRTVYRLAVGGLLLGGCSRDRVERGDLPFSVEHRTIYTVGKSDTDAFSGAPLSSVIMRSGGIAAADSRDLDVRLVDSTGVQTSRFGSRGVAPGRFSEVTSILDNPDGSIWIVDALLNRLTHIDARGRSIGTRSLPPLDSQPIRVFDVDDNRILAAVAMSPSSEEATPSLVHDTLFIFELRGTSTEWVKIAELAIGESVVFSSNGALRRIQVVPGSRFVQSCRDHLRVFGGNGWWKVDLPGAVSPLPSAADVFYSSESDVNRHAQFVLQYLPDPRARASIADFVRSIAGSLKSSRLAVVDRQGRAWLKSSTERRGHYEQWDGKEKIGELLVSGPRFFVDADDNRLLAVQPESDSTSSSLEVILSERSAGNPRSASVRCGPAVRVPFE